MLIDWFTTGAQLLNFLILVWLMKRFLYRPVLAAIAAREAGIAAQLGDAAARQTAATQEGASYRQKIADFERERTASMSAAVAQAQTERERIVGLGKAACDAMRDAQVTAMEEAKKSLSVEVGAQVREEVFKTVRQTLAQLADASLEASMVRRFAQRIAEMEPAGRTQLAAALATDPTKAVIRSATPLDDAARVILTEALRDIGLGELALSFEVAPRLVCGMEFCVGGWKLAWNVDACLDGMEWRAAALLKETGVEAAPPAKRVSLPSSTRVPEKAVAPS
jgi:F-type H+-transporting ATPase subunit b